MSELVHDLNNEPSLQPCNANGVTGANAIPRNFDALYAMPGHHMRFRGFPVVSSNANRERLGLSNDMSDRQLAICRAFFKVFTEMATDAPIRIADGSLSGQPYMLKDRVSKRAIALHAVQHYDEIISLLHAGKLEELYRKYDFILAAFAGGRIQQEGPMKVRKYFTPEAAYIEGAYVANDADKSLDFDPRFCRSRSRVVIGVALCINAILAYLIRPFELCFMHNYPLTFKHRTKESVAEKLTWKRRQLRERYVNFATVKSDVTQFDSTFHPLMNTLMGEALADAYGDERLVEAYRMLMSPVVLTPPQDGDGVYSIVASGSPFDKQYFTSSAGALLSGTYPTAVSGRCAIICNHLIMCDAIMDHDFTDPDVIRAHLRWEHDLFNLNGGDDNIAGGSAKLLEMYKQQMPNSLYKVEPEDSSVFLGPVYMYDDVQHVYKAAPVMNTFFTKTFNRERDYYHRLTPNWAGGLKDKLRFYSSAPTAGTCFDILDRVHHKHYGYTFTGYVESLDATPLTLEQKFLENPSLIYHDPTFMDLADDLIELAFEPIWPSEMPPRSFSAHVKEIDPSAVHELESDALFLINTGVNYE